MAVPLEGYPIFGDFYSFFIPFLLIFALVYALLSKTEYMSTSKAVNSVIAFAIAFIVALSSASTFLLKIIPFFAAFLIIIFAMFLLLSFIGYKAEDLLASKGFVMGLALAGILFVVSTSWFLYQAEIEEAAGTGLGFAGSGNASFNETTNMTIEEPACDYSGQIDRHMIMCMLKEPGIIGAIIIVITISVIVRFFVHPDVRKENF